MTAVRRKAGAKKKTVSAAQMRKVKLMARAGCTDKQIYSALGISHETFYKNKREQAEFSDAIDIARNEGLGAIANAHYNAAMDGDVKAQQFILARRAGWSETQQLQALDEKGDKTKWTIEFVNADMVNNATTKD